MDVARTQWQCSESAEINFSSMPRSHNVHGAPIATCLRCHYVHAVLDTSSLRPDSATSSLRFLHVQSSTTSFTSMKTFLRSYRLTTLLLHTTSSYYVHPVFKDVVRTWPSVKGVLNTSII